MSIEKPRSIETPHLGRLSQVGKAAAPNKIKRHLHCDRTAEPLALGSMRARDHARRHFGKPAARTVAEYEAYATSPAFLRHRGRRGRAGADFAVRERELLHELWRRREVAQPALNHVARMTVPVAAPPWPAYGPAAPYPSYNPYRTQP